MRILIVSFLYRPSISPRAIRWSAIAEHWAGQGHDVEVLCGWTPGLAREETARGVRVHRIGCGLSERLRQRLRGPEGPPRAGPSSSSGRSVRVFSGVQRLLRWGHDRVWKKLYWPDYACLWYFSAVHTACKQLRRNPFDVLITSSLPFTGHMVGLRLKHRCPDLPWLVDVGDPLHLLKGTPSNNHAIYDKLNLCVEKKVFARADAISVTNENMQDLYTELFPASAPRMCVIQPLLSNEVHDQPVAKLFPPDRKIRLVFVGTLYPNIRSPKPLLQTFRQLLLTPVGARLELHFFGRINCCEREFDVHSDLVGRKIFLHGEVDYKTARQAMAEADFLINIGNTTTFQFPSKAVEYVGSGKPILNFITTLQDSSARFFSRYPAAMTVRLKPGAEEDGVAFQRLVKFLEGAHPIDSAQREAWCVPFQLPSIAGHYDQLIAEAQSHARTRPRAA